jgi:hypothetical protein
MFHLVSPLRLFIRTLMVNGEVASGRHLDGDCLLYAISACGSNSQAAACNVGQLQVAAGLAPNPSRATQAAPRESDSTEVNQCD